jgi:hypothetical protein
MTDLMISSPLDQETPTNGDWALEMIDQKVNEAIELQDVTILFETIKRLRELAKVTGLALAKALYMVHKHWDVFGDAANFGDEVFAGTGLHQHTSERYVKVWAMFTQNYIPEHLESDFKQKNIKDLIPIANALYQGYEIEDDDWEELAASPDYASVAKVVRDNIKHAEPRKNSLRLFLKRDGTVMCYKGQQQEPVAWLDVTSDSKLIQQAVERIKKNSGMLEE